MHLAFVDIAYGYNAGRPDQAEPLGGTTSAVCFLARELVKKGIKCSFFNKTACQETVHAIISRPLQDLSDPIHTMDISAFIYCGRWMEEMVRFLKENTKGPHIAWMHEAQFNQKLVAASDAFDGVVFVSEWQQKINKSYFKPHWKEAIFRNAMNPATANLFSPSNSILITKKNPTTLLYAGGAVRGAFHLPKILEHLDQNLDSYSMEIFCNTNPSGQPDLDAEYIKWLRERPHVTHVGMVGQPRLIKHMKEATIMVAPNPWPETSCIAMIEAMAAGLTVITTDRAALPETAAGFAQLIAIEDAGHPSRFDGVIDHEVFAKVIFATLEDIKTDPEKNEKRLRSQVDYFHANYQWSQRVRPWVDYIEGLNKERP